MGCTDTEFSLTLVDADEMARLNREYRGIPETTDVLAFPMHEGAFGDVAPEMLGDVVISVSTAEEMARLHGATLEAVLDLLLVHGTLHLVGFDHERGPEDAGQMLRKSTELLRMLGHTEADFAWYLDEPSD